MRIRYSLKQSLIAYFLLIAILPIMVVSIFLNSIIVNYMVKDIQESNRTLSNFVISQTHTYFTKASDFLNLVGFMLSDDEIIHDHDTNQLLGELLVKQNYFEAIELLDKNFTVKSIAPFNEAYIGINLKNEFFLNPDEMDTMGIWSSTFNSVYTHNSTLSHIIKLDDGRYIIGYLNLSSIREINSIINDPTINITILDDKGIYITDNDKALVSQRAYNPDFDKFKQSLKTHKTFLDMPHLDKHVYITIDQIKDTNWIVLAIQSDDATRSVTRDIGLLFILIFLGIFVLVIFLAILSSRQIMMPVIQLNDKFSEIIEGDFTSPILYNGYIELQNLIIGFNQMIDIIKKRDYNISRLAYFDSLTHLPNRVQINEFIDKTIEKKQVPFFGILYIDIDNFKNINDTLGHAFGDALIKQLSIELQSHLQTNDLISRYGGDEFVIYLRRNTRDQLWKDTKLFLDEIKGALQIDDLKIEFTLSAGFAIYPDHADSRDELIKAVDMATNYAKDHGKNQLTLFSFKILDEFMNRINLENDLKKAVQNKELRLYYQPQVFSSDGTIRGAEALVRWQHPNGTLISPAVFIPLAEDLGIIREIGDWVISEACSQMHLWHTQYSTPLVISINISPVQLLSEDFIDRVFTLIADTRILISKVEFEITENVLIHSLDRTIKSLKKLSEHGLQISLDDFGMEYSSLNYLGALDINVLKIDKAFVSTIMNDPRRTKILDAIIKLSHQLGLEIIAEGVETQQQLNYLKAKKCDILQGYYYDKPLPPNEFETRYLKNRG
ncbi:EAL domain-containing protein [Fusibacter sp. 3D3]|uniref:bifunctional diguanylate cyclase/phosphodiesterase n=1 Tax=Fusibacter sp. 3D3 TaxID=1048380 RepID=UPI00085353D9|nr:EAL domain-containing protein [Fusibacter sp. 3D3]GAU77272.1 diguanylate cyclase/phosphodiesterase [Fusibacter sp. 3D3]